MYHLFVVLMLSIVIANADYSTSFDATENPISQNGKWTNGATNGIDWKNVRTSGGYAFGTQTGSDNYQDSTAILTGIWNVDQSIEGVVYSINQNASISEEVECRLRSTITAHSCTGYEVLFRCTHDGSQYVQIVRWNGAVGDFTVLNATTGPGISNGDTVKGEIVGTTIKAYINNKVVLSWSDGTYSSGNPGIGFYLSRASSATNADFGFTSVTATGSSGNEPPVAIPSPPTGLRILTTQ